MSKELKKLDEFNEQRRQLYWFSNLNIPELNGIACPKCNEELFDSNPTIILRRLRGISRFPPRRKLDTSFVLIASMVSLDRFS